MAKYLVIVESPSKATKIGQYLGKDYYVMASKGHVIDLPAKGLNVDIKKNFEPHYEIMEDKVDTVAKIVSEAKKAEIVYLMSDPDREGEAIAFHISNHLPKNTVFKRATTNSITKEAVKKAIDEASDINIPLVDSYEARRILDRLVGYKCSYLTQSATGGKSAGRVQSAALRALSDREKEIKAFVPQEYWDINAEVLTQKKDKILTRLTKPEKMEVSNEEKANTIVSYLTKKTASVSKYETKEVPSSPYAPFTTSTLQQTAATVLGWSQDKTMSVAQALYENSFITYMRTDSPYIEPATIAGLRTEIQGRFGPKYLPDKTNYYAPKSKNAQEAHEAIRPTHVEVEQINELESDHKKLYNLIWRRTVASQMEKSRSLSASVRFAVGPYELGANGNTLIFDGWKKVWQYALSDDTLLPVLNVGDKCEIIDVSSEQKFTQPPSRYSKSSITKLYEETGIGRPSTYASITKTLIARKYIDLLKNSYQVTALGLKVSEFLEKSGFCFIDLDFTSKMEEKLDRITNKEAKKLDTLSEFWERLQKDITNAKSLKANASQTDFPCPKCKNMLALKHSKFGPFFACSEQKECGYTAIVGPDGEPKEKPPKEYGSEPCQLCSAKMVKRNSKMGGFFGCEKFPTCRGMRNLQGEPIEQKKTEGKKPWKKWKKN